MAKNIVPTRMCAGCMQRRPKGELLRVFRDKDGSISADIDKKYTGRGAYVCANRECIQKVQKKNSFARMLKAKTEPEIFEKLSALADRE